MAQTGLPLGLQLVLNQVLAFEDLLRVISIQALLRDKSITWKNAMDTLDLSRRKDITLPVAFDLLGIDVKPTLKHRLGALLIDSETVEHSKMKKSLALCKESGLPLGRILVATGELKVDIVEKALQLQKLIRDNEIDRESATDTIAGLKSFLGSVSQFGIDRRDDDIGLLLLNADLLKQEDLDDAAKLSRMANIPITESLIDLKYVPSETLNVAQVIQQMIAAKRISRRSAIELLQRVHQTEAFLTGTAVDHAKESNRKESGVSFEQFLRLTHLIPATADSKNSHDQQSLKTARRELEDTWEILPSAAEEKSQTLGILPRDVSECLERNGFLTPLKKRSVAVAARQFKLFRQSVLNIDQAIVTCLLAKENEDCFPEWSGTFPSLSVWLPNKD